MTWNHRVIRHADKHRVVGVDVWFGIHECIYDNPRDDIPTSWTEEPIAPVEGTPHQLLITVHRLKEAMEKPILEIDGEKLKVWNP